MYRRCINSLILLWITATVVFFFKHIIHALNNTFKYTWCHGLGLSLTGCYPKVIKVKVKVQAYSLISSLKTYHPTLHLTPWSLDLFIRGPFQLHGEHKILQLFRRIELIVHIAISVLLGTHFHLSQVKQLRVKCLAQGHNIITMSQD